MRIDSAKPVYYGDEDGIEITVRTLRAQRNGEQMALTVDIGNGEETETRNLVISAEQYFEMNLKKGRISEETFERLEKASEFCMALRCGENLLSYGPSSVHTLVGKIMRHGFSREESVQAAEKLREMGLIDESAHLKSEVEKCLRKLWGVGKIRGHLFSKGFAPEAMEELGELLEEVDFSQNCARLIQKHYGGLPENREEKNRMTAGLYRYGYSLDEIKQAIRLLKEED